MRLAFTTVVVVITIASVACSRKQPAVADVAVDASFFPNGAGSASSAKDAALDAVVAPSAADARSDAKPPRLGIAGTTRMTIACGASRCPAETNVCVLTNGAWKCVTADEASRGASDESYACDDASDCTSQPDMTCCVASGFRRERTTCGYRNAADADPCTLEVCDSGEGAAPCPKGQACIDGVCRAPTAQRASCSSKDV